MASIMIVEDDEFLGKLLVKLFVERQHFAYWAGDYEQMEEVLKNNQIDLIFLDVMLPKKDGFDILKDLKVKDSKYRFIPVVMLTNLSELHEIQRAMDLGAVDHLIKANIDFHEFVKMVEDKWIWKGV